HNRGWVVDDVLCVVEATVDEERRCENPGKRDESCVNSLQYFDFFPVARALLQNDRKKKSGEENHTKKDQHQVDIERREDLADVRECQRAEQENRRTKNEAPTEHDLGRSRSQAT